MEIIESLKLPGPLIIRIALDIMGSGLVQGICPVAIWESALMLCPIGACMLYLDKDDTEILGVPTELQ